MPLRLATAVLYALMSVAGVAPAEDLADDDTYDDGDVGLAEPGRAEPGRGLKRGAPGVLALASTLSAEPIADAWSAVGHDDHTLAAVAIRTPAAHVARIDLAAEPFLAPHALATLGPPLLARALDHCREHDVLKVIVSSEGLPPVTVRTVAESRGFQFSRTRLRDNDESIEFYTNLYWREGDDK